MNQRHSLAVILRETNGKQSLTALRGGIAASEHFRIGVLQVARFPAGEKPNPFRRGQQSAAVAD